jgi:hypothetical protein
MNRLIVSLVLVFVFTAPAWAKPNKYDIASRQTWFNNLTDQMATMGEPPLKAQQIIKQRKITRKRERLKKLSQAERKRFQAKRERWMNEK